MWLNSTQKQLNSCPELSAVVTGGRATDSQSVGPGFESPMVHQRKALRERRAFFFCSVFGKAVPGAPSGTRTARPGGQRPARFQQSSGLLESARVPPWPDWSERWLLPCTTIQKKRPLPESRALFLCLMSVPVGSLYSVQAGMRTAAEVTDVCGENRE